MSQPPAGTPTPAINTNVRLFDLVRYQRAELHEKDLITDDEYAWLSGGSPMAHSKQGGSPSPRRLEDYDGIRAEQERLTCELGKAFVTTEEQIRLVASVTAERDALRKALEVAVNTVECDSIYLLTDGVTREELPWYKGARAALAPRQPKERK